MSIYINKDTKVITQGITGKTGQFHTEKCIEYANGKNCFVAGVNPKKAGEKIFDVPIYASVKEAAQGTGATVDRKSTRLNSSHSQISYAVFCLKKKKKKKQHAKHK